MKNRVQLSLEDVPYKLLRVMAAEEGKSMSDVVSEFLMGERRNVAGEEEAEEILKEHDLEPDEDNAEEIDTTKLPDTHNEVVEEVPLCEIGKIDTTGASKCARPVAGEWRSPVGFYPSGAFKLCEQHLKTIGK